MVDTENLRPHYARTLWHWSMRWRPGFDEAREVLGAPAARGRPRILRAYRLYLAGSAMSFEQGWIALHQMLSAKPDKKVKEGPLRGAQSVYPFSRLHLQ